MDLETESRDLNRILAAGRPGRALIVGHVDTGERVEGNPVWIFELQVTPEGAPAYPVRHREVVSAAATSGYPIGTSLPCRIDPADPSRIAFGRKPFM